MADPSDLEIFADDPDRALGAVQDASNHTIAPFSNALSIGALNLMKKAVVAEGDDRERLVDRALALPFDEHEKAHPAAMAAVMQLFTAVTDALEESDEEDEAWLDAALEVLHYSDPLARSEVRHNLEIIDDEYDLDRPTRIRLHRELRALPRDPEWIEMVNRPHQQLRDRVLAVLAATNHFDEAYLEAQARYE